MNYIKRVPIFSVIVSTALLNNYDNPLQLNMVVLVFIIMVINDLVLGMFDFTLSIRTNLFRKLFNIVLVFIALFSNYSIMRDGNGISEPIVVVSMLAVIAIYCFLVLPQICLDLKSYMTIRIKKSN